MAVVQHTSGWRVFQDLKGQVFGRLRVVAYDGRRNKTTFWQCVCECGEKRIVPAGALKKGNTKSCGCLNIDRIRERNTTHGHSKRLPEYKVWKTMRQRCLNKKNKRYSEWGGRGVKICERWNDFSNFLADMGPRPSPKHSIDRFPDNFGNYEPDNCRWATLEEQGRNKRNNRLITIDAETKSLAEWAERSGLGRDTIRGRLKLGWDARRAVFTPVTRNYRGSEAALPIQQ